MNNTIFLQLEKKVLDYEIRSFNLLSHTHGLKILPSSNIKTNKISSLYKAGGPPKMHPDPGLHFQTPPGKLPVFKKSKINTHASP